MKSYSWFRAIFGSIINAQHTMSIARGFDRAKAPQQEKPRDLPVPLMFEAHKLSVVLSWSWTYRTKTG